MHRHRNHACAHRKVLMWSHEDIRCIYSNFPIVERQEVGRCGSYRTRDLALAWINALIAGQPDAEVSG